MNWLSRLYPLPLAMVFILTHGTPTYAASVQQDDPVAQCAEGVQLFLDGQAAEALPLAEAGFVRQEQTTLADPDDLGLCALVVGLLRDGGSNYSGALEAYQVALDIFQTSGNREFEGITLNNIGAVYKAQGRYAEALENYQQALAISREVGDRAGEGATLNNIGGVYSAQGRYAEALENYQQALAIVREVGNRAGEGATLNNLGLVYNYQGQYAEALENYQQALTIQREVGDRAGEGATLTNIGLVYNNQGQYAEALESYQEALAIRREVGDRAGEGATLNNIAAVYDDQGRYAEALESYQEALAIAREVGDYAGEGTTLAGMGLIYANQGRYAEALENYQQALAIQREVGDRAGEGATLNNIAAVYDAQGRYAEALESYQEALAIRREVGDRAGEGATLSNIAAVYDDQGQYAEAMKSYQQALAILREVGDRAGEGAALSNLGLVYDAQGRYAEAMKNYQEALAILREVGDRAGEGAILHNIAAVYDDQGRYAAALENYQEALAIRREVGDRAGEGATLHSIAAVYDDQGRYAEALESYQEALAIAREVGNRAGEGTTLSNIGLVYDAQGRYAEALDIYQQALAIAREVGDRAGEGTTFNNIGGVYEAQGRYAEALDSYQQALTVAREVGDRVGEGIGLINIGAVYRVQSRYAEAMKSYQEALVILREVGNRTEEGATLANIAAVYAAQGQYAEALDSFQQSLAIRREVGDRTGEGATLHNIGAIYRLQGRLTEALDSYQEALAIRREVGDRAGEGDTLQNMGEFYRAQKQYVEALDSFQQAMAVFETIRATAGSEAGRAGYIAQYTPTYEAVIALLHQQSRDEDAFFTAERGRARAFLDALATGQVQLSDNATADLLALEQKLYAQRQVIQDNLAKARAQNPPAPDLVSDLEKQLAQADADYIAIQAKITARSDQLADLIPGRNRHVLTVAQVQALLEPQTTLLSYYLLADKTLAFLLTRDSFQVVELPISHEELTKKVNALRKFVDTQTPDITRQYLQELYQALIAPLNEALTQGGEAAHRLLVVPHGVLHYLPFTALLDPETDEYLLQQYELVMLPSASVLQFVTVERQQGSGGAMEQGGNLSPAPLPPSSPALIVGNPATGDFDATASLAAERAGLARLPFAEAEARAIAALYGVEPLIGEAATESAVREKVGAAGILHLAAHGFYNSAAPLSSLIALAPDEANRKSEIENPKSADGWLTVGEVYGLNLQQTDLVVLSACQTQLGELKTIEGKVQLDVTAGDDVVGLTRSFLFAGAPTVVATLWNVNDEATQLLMERFYSHLKEGGSKAEALRQAQMELVEYDNGRYADPYYWAAFVLSGDGGKTSEQPGLISARVGNEFITGGLLIGGVGVIIMAWVLWRRARRE